MPELPEVQTVVNNLNKTVKNKIITSVEVFYPKLVKFPSVAELVEKLQNQTILEVRRLGKYILFMFAHYVLISHLRMEGRWYFEKSDDDFVNKHYEIVLNFQDGTRLTYYDSRKFGTLHLYSIDDYLESTPLRKLGQEPFDQNFDFEAFYNKVKRSSKHIKTLLLDQELITGIGNIYANEICFATKINPKTVAKTLSRTQIESIFNETKKILLEAIEMGGTTIHTYYPEKDKKGGFQDFLKVHGKNKSKCVNCNSEIIKIQLNGRGTYYCPVCQAK